MTENTQHRITIKIQESTEILNNYKDHDKRYHIPKIEGCLFIQLDSTVEFTGNKGSAKKDHQG